MSTPTLLTLKLRGKTLYRPLPLPLRPSTGDAPHMGRVLSGPPGTEEAKLGAGAGTS